MTILDLARESGVDIPTLCYDPHLTSIGACRLCLVENEQTGALMASCVTPIAPGMVINTHSPRVLEHRKTIIQLMLASHPDTCMVCDKGNHCKLRQFASDMGIGLVELQRIPQMAAIEEVNPFIQRDMSKCILCAKCIRADQELVVEGAIDYFRRGFITKPATLNDLPLEDSECTFCGTCVAICPTGALMEKDREYRGTTKTATLTTCPYCGCGCSISLEVKDNSIVRVTPGEEDSVNQSTLCVRGSYGYDFVNSSERLTKPLIKVNGNFEEVSWEQALEAVANKLGGIKDKHGPHSLAVLSSSKITNEENYLLQRLARCVFGTNNIDNGSRLYNSSYRIGLGPSIGYTGTTNYLSALEQSEVILVIGADPTSSSPMVGYAIKRAVKFNGAKLILIDPRRAKLSSFAHLWLRPRVGTEVVLLNSLAKVIIDEELLDEEFVIRKTDNFNALSKSLEEYSSQYVEAITGISGDEIHAAAQLYATADQTAIVYGSGITQYKSGTDSVKTIANLAILTGNIGQVGSGIYALQRDNNGQGACDMGTIPNFLPGYQSIADAQARKRFEECWEVSLSGDRGLTTLESMEQAREGKIKGMYIVGENPLLSFPHPSQVTEALASLDFLVVQDMFLTETAKLAQVVLPAASFAEKDGTFTNFEGRIGRVRKAIEPRGESLPDWEIILRLAGKMNRPLPFSSPQQVMDEVQQLVPTYTGYADSKKPPQAEMGSWETMRTYGGKFLKGFVRFSPVEYTPDAQEAMGDYPFTLIAGTMLYHFGTGTRSSKAWRLKKYYPEALVELSTSDARKLNINNNDKLKVTSPTGEVTATVKVTDTLSEGTLFMPISFPETPVNKLFGIVLDPQSKTPSLKSCSVKIERIAPHG